MSTSLGAYHDDLMETIVSGANPITFNPSVGNVTDPPRKPITIGGPEVGIRYERKTLPGVNQLQAIVVDLEALNGGSIMQPATAYKLALTEAELDDAVAGAPLNLGYSILSGVETGRKIWIEGSDGANLVGIAKNLVIMILDVQDTPV
jgi:hypothetical protein